MTDITGEAAGMMKVIVQAVLAALVLGIVGAVSIALGQPLLVPSLGTAVLLQVHFRDLPSAAPWNTAIGQVCGVVCGFGAVLVLGATADPSFSETQPLLASRVLATMLSVAATLLLQTILKAASPARGATALILTLGAETADWAGFGRLVTAILLVTVLGEGARRIVLRISDRAKETSEMIPRAIYPIAHLNGSFPV